MAMTPKEKAKDLFGRYNELIKQGCVSSTSWLSKELVLIAVEEIIEVILTSNLDIFETYDERKYWNEVLKEIDNIK